MLSHIRVDKNEMLSKQFQINRKEKKGKEGSNAFQTMLIKSDRYRRRNENERYRGTGWQPDGVR